MDRRLELQKILVEKLGSKYVYFNPNETAKLTYPCIVYHFASIKSNNADDKKYINRKCYKMQFISREQNDEVVEKLLDIPFCSHMNHSIIDQLHHDTFTLYY